MGRGISAFTSVDTKVKSNEQQYSYRANECGIREVVYKLAHAAPPA